MAALGTSGKCDPAVFAGAICVNDSTGTVAVFTSSKTALIAVCMTSAIKAGRWFQAPAHVCGCGQIAGHVFRHVFPKKKKFVALGLGCTRTVGNALKNLMACSSPLMGGRRWTK